MKERTYLIELHDLSPARNQGSIKKMFDWIRDVNPPFCLCLFIPEEDGPDTWACLKDHLTKVNGQPVLHGLTHQGRAGLWDRFWFGESFGAEFINLTPEETKQRIVAGRVSLEEKLGEPVTWFCAPRWRQNRETILALRELSFRGIMTRNSLFILDGSKNIPIPVLSYDHGQRSLVLKMNRRLRKIQKKSILRSGRPFRWALHPVDFENCSISKEIETFKETLQSEGWKAAGREEYHPIFQ